MRRLSLLALPLALGGCPQPAPRAPATPPQATAPAARDDPAADRALGGYHWELVDATDAAGVRLPGLFVRAERPVTLDFTDGRLLVSNTCNRLSGGYALQGGAVTVARLASTLMACADAALMALDGDVAHRLQGRLAMRHTPGDPPALQLTNAGGDRLLFSGRPTPETRYGGFGDTVFWEVAARTEPCPHPLIPDFQCLQVRELHYDAQGLRTGTPGPYGNVYDGIEGYTHAPGVRTVLRLKRFTVQDPPADAPSVAYVLDRVVETAREPR